MKEWTVDTIFPGWHLMISIKFSSEPIAGTDDEAYIDFQEVDSDEWPVGCGVTKVTDTSAILQVSENARA